MSRWICFVLTALLAAGCSLAGGTAPDKAETIRLGYMPNLTHAQAVIGVADGSFERAVGARVVPRLFSAGPAAVQALFAGELDLLYVGPAPAVTGYIRSRGEQLRVVAGAASGGALLVGREGVDADRLAGRRIASPGLANSQDVALRHLIQEKGLRTKDAGGNVTLLPMAPAEILSLFARGELDGAWVPEPWGARLIQEAGARLLIDERELWPEQTFATTLLVARPGFLEEHREEAKRFLEAHVTLTHWIQQNPAQAQKQLQEALGNLQGRPLPDSIMAEAFGRVDFRSDPMIASVEEQARRAFRLGFLGPRKPDLSGLYDLSLLQEVDP